jgi:hypothetical protein
VTIDEDNAKLINDSGLFSNGDDDDDADALLSINKSDQMNCSVCSSAGRIMQI